MLEQWLFGEVEVPPATSEVVHQGYLSKPGRVSGSQVRRYYRLHLEGLLLYV